MTVSLPCKCFSGTLAVLMSLGIFTGCKSSTAQFVSPRVTGRVLDSRSHQPIARVQVQRLLSVQNADAEVAPHGGETLQQPSPAWTGADGTFVLDATRDLFNRGGWFAVNVSYARAGYETLVTNYTLANAVLSSNGVPVVNAGDILLPPLPK